MVPADTGSVMATFTDIRPDAIYNLSGQSAVGLSFDQSREAADISVSIADPSRARSVLSWNAETRAEALVNRLVQAALSGAVY